MPPLWHTIEMTPGPQRLHLVERRGERRGDRRRGIDDADAVGPAEHEPSLPAQRDQRALQHDALASRLGQAARVGDAVPYAASAHSRHRIEQRVRRNREDDEFRHLGEFGDAGNARQPAHGDGRPVDRPHAARELELHEAAHRVAAEVARLIRSADDGDRARLEERSRVDERRGGG